jgi:predicted  nucleic acid-binding Zn-ribbon protein
MATTKTDSSDALQKELDETKEELAQKNLQLTQLASELQILRFRLETLKNSHFKFVEGSLQ